MVDARNRLGGSELLKNHPNEVVIEAGGYEPVRATFPRKQKHREEQ